MVIMFCQQISNDEYKHIYIYIYKMVWKFEVANGSPLNREYCMWGIWTFYRSPSWPLDRRYHENSTSELEDDSNVTKDSTTWWDSAMQTSSITSSQFSISYIVAVGHLRTALVMWLWLTLCPPPHPQWSSSSTAARQQDPRLPTPCGRRAEGRFLSQQTVLSIDLALLISVKQSIHTHTHIYIYIYICTLHISAYIYIYIYPETKETTPTTSPRSSARPLLAAASAAWCSRQSHAPVEGCRSPAVEGHATGKSLGEFGLPKMMMSMYFIV